MCSNTADEETNEVVEVVSEDQAMPSVQMRSLGGSNEMRNGKFKAYIVAMISVLMCLALFMGCTDEIEKASSGEEKKVPIPVEVKEILSANRFVDDIDEEKVKEGFGKLLYKFDRFDEVTNEEVIYGFSEQIVDEIIVEEALIDVDHVFRLLKYGYAGYQYFGGDESFLSAKENMIQEISKRDKVISTNDLSKILYNHLSFIQDGHFTISGRELFQRHNYYMSETYAFFKDVQGYYMMIDEEKYYLIEVAEEEIEDYLKLSLNEDGEIVYYLGEVYPSRTINRKVNIKLKSDTKTINETIAMRMVISRENFKGSSVYNYSEIGDMPMIEIRSMSPKTQKDVEQIQNFAEDAKKLKDEDYFIIDVRGNGGGGDSYSFEWIKNYTGQTRETFIMDRIESHLDTEITIGAMKYSMEFEVDLELRKEAEDLIERIVLEDYYPGWTPLYIKQPQRLNNENIIFVIMDEGIASSGESFISMLRQMENVIFVGTNTAGVYLASGGAYTLPHSHIPIGFGQSLFLNSKLEDREGIGFMPDFWVSPDQAIDRILKFIGES
ncbi:peptidase S41 [Alkaliphilus metalliredigens QYMF]|uniref:Peptidase S41 n=1 Tax=Alkaliphilus metalliredigens (strain QYMF) TaxID=293826 RepID=A6TPD4_ALKMQ|nr:S41 family peptidase [Alkaliphilus metalliredigens]ABR48052.1 peptidase S41 [Alkaliphilus metalliredigens QYMF]